MTFKLVGNVSAFAFFAVYPCVLCVKINWCTNFSVFFFTVLDLQTVNVIQSHCLHLIDIHTTVHLVLSCCVSKIISGEAEDTPNRLLPFSGQNGLLGKQKKREHMMTVRREHRLLYGSKWQFMALLFFFVQ